MKTRTRFCKIPKRNGGYKWPTLTELYQNCFYPGYSMRIFPDETSASNVHSADIDAAMTAQCFFKLKDLGFFKELTTTTTVNSLSAEQKEDNFEDLHDIDKSDGMSAAYRKTPLAKVFIRWLKGLWPKYWQMVCGTIIVITAALTFYFQFLR